MVVYRETDLINSNNRSNAVVPIGFLPKNLNLLITDIN